MPSQTDPGPVLSPLARADAAALAHSDRQAVDGAAIACPYAQAEDKWVIEIVVVGEDGRGLDGIGLLVVRGDGQVVSGTTGADGVYRFRGLDPGRYRLRLPDLDQDAWRVADTRSLPAPDARCGDKAAWHSAPASAAPAERVHAIRQGECVAKIAERYGFFPETIWAHGANADLKAARHGNMYILFPGDQVVVPARREKEAAVVAGDRVVVQRQGVPERLRIRFLDGEGMPRAGVPYVLGVTTADGSPAPAVAGMTTGDGYVDEWVPPSAVYADITLGAGPDAEAYGFDVGYVDPIDTPSGVAARLRNLGIDDVASDSAPEDVALAIERFQYLAGIERTGVMDAATVTMLERKHGS
jgi:hypothetical protein